MDVPSLQHEIVHDDDPAYRRNENVVAAQEGYETRTRCQQLPGYHRQRDDTAEQLTTNNREVLREETCDVRAKGDGVAANIDSKDRKGKAEGGEEAACTCAGTPEAVEDCVEQVPLVPVGLTEFTLDSGGGANAEEEDEGLAGEDGRGLAPAGVFGTFGVTGEVRLLVGVSAGHRSLGSLVYLH